MHRRTERISIDLSLAEHSMLEHLAMAERVPKAFIVRRLIRDAARDLYDTIEEAEDAEEESCS